MNHSLIIDTDLINRDFDLSSELYSDTEDTDINDINWFNKHIRRLKKVPDAHRPCKTVKYDSSDNKSNCSPSSIEVKEYVYKPLDIINKNIHEIPEYFFTSVFIYAYSINTSGKEPFIELVLHKFHSQEMFSDLLKFPGFLTINQNNVLNDATKILNNTLKQKDTNYEYDFKGFFIEDVNLYLFVDCSELLRSNRAKLVKRNDTLWMVLIDEIINHKSTCNFKIDEDIIRFFNKNPECLVLHSRNGEMYETPTVAYAGREESMLEFTAVMGVSQADSDDTTAPMGQYYYFTDYVTAFLHGGWSKTNEPEIKYNKLITYPNSDKYLKGGIIKFALFLGNMKVIIGIEDNDPDESLKRKSIINQNDISRRMMEITDYDGLWANMYDSVHINPKIDCEKEQTKTPLWVLKVYEQQLPLCYHYIDKSTLQDKWDEKSNYYIV